jgi:hypothetical protein
MCILVGTNLGCTVSGMNFRLYETEQFILFNDMLIVKAKLH